MISKRILRAGSRVFLALVCVRPGIAATHVWSKPMLVDGEKRPVIISPHHFDSSTKHTAMKFAPYTIDYLQLSKQLRYYEWVYFVGQAAHGGLMLMVKPKFVPY